MSETGKTENRYGLVGYPLGHTMSPFIHDRLFRLSGRPHRYDLLEISPEALEARKADLFSYRGLNVTIPHKSSVIALLARLSDEAHLYGAVNLIDCETRTGHNTDAKGFRYALRDAGVPLAGRVVLCGAGGAARVMAYESVSAGADLTLAVRASGLEKARALAAEIPLKTGRPAPKVETLDEVTGTVDLLINATPVGMHPNPEDQPVSDAVVKRSAAVFDAVYNPEKTRLLRTAEAAGARTVGGMPMLVWQAVRAHEIWYGATFRDEDVRRLIHDANREMNRRFGREEPT